jgi:nanoRNase/pAp phosphatase (c-di-AMP/oligoRNAs hydrolase)
MDEQAENDKINNKIDPKMVDKWLSVIDSNQNIAIVCHDQPDPDCLASAFAIQILAQSRGKNAFIYYGGEIPYTQNSVMMNVLNISAIKLEEDEDNDEDELTQQIKNNIKKSCIVVVDTSANFGKENNIGIFPFLEKDRKPDIVIDHHTINPTLDCPMYINKQYGSCSTILLEMLTSLNITINKGLATALYLGISTDTADLKSEGTVQNDIDAMDFLRSIMDVELLRKIYDYPKPLALLELRKRAYSNFYICGNNLTIANVGVVNPQQRALLAKLCEEMLEVESIESALVMGVVDEGFDKPKFLICSFRTGVLGINVSQFIQKIFGKKYSGGRRGAGAAKVPLDDKISSVIDFAKRQENSAIRIEQIVAPFFEYYGDKAKIEKSNT